MPDDSLIIRYLSGEATPEEAIQLESWLEASAVNREAFNQLWQSWQYAATEPYVTPETASDWRQLLQRWQQAGLPTAATATLQWLVRALPIVLSSLVAAALAIWLLWPKGNKIAAPVVKAAAAAVVKDTLPDNTSYTLDVNSRAEWLTTDRQLVLHGGIMLKNTAPMQLSAGKILLYASPGYFYVNYDSVQQQTIIYVAEGSLQIHTANGDTTLGKDASLLVDEKQGQWLTDYVVNKNRFSFATRHFYFEATPLPEVAAYLEKAYGITIKVPYTAIRNCSLTGQFNYVPVTEILDIVALTLPITYVYKEAEHTVYLYGEGCK
jgi:ferric-dicitrate binding protein FerR (iron transport regulator)